MTIVNITMTVGCSTQSGLNQRSSQAVTNNHSWTIPNTQTIMDGKPIASSSLVAHSMSPPWLMGTSKLQIIVSGKLGIKFGNLLTCQIGKSWARDRQAVTLDGHSEYRSIDHPTSLN